MSYLRAQAFIADGFLALLLAIALAYMLGMQNQGVNEGKQVRLVHACYDLTNAFYLDEKLYGNVSSSLNSTGSISNQSMQVLRNRLSHYGALLEVSSIDFEVKGVQKEHIQIAGSRIQETERCCFPIIANRNAGTTFIACMDVSA